MNGMALPRFSGPKYFVSRWIDFNVKYSLGYQLSDSNVSILIKDNSRHVVDGSMKIFKYIDKNGVRDYFEYDNCPTRLGKRFKLLGYFKNFMETYLLAEPLVEGRRKRNQSC
uniref:Polo kinase n=1 Tax=Strongyloides venezuelensis TaxID=75913 RepID=A0A0K0G279_STRVS